VISLLRARPSTTYAIYSLYYIYFSQHNYIIKAYIKATCFDLKSHRRAKLRTMKFFTMWLYPFGISDGSQCVLWFVPWYESQHTLWDIWDPKYHGTNHSTYSEPSGIPNTMVRITAHVVSHLGSQIPWYESQHTLWATWDPKYHGTNHSTHCEPSGIPNAHSHAVKNFMVLSLAWRWLFKSKHVALTYAFII